MLNLPKKHGLILQYAECAKKPITLAIGLYKNL